VPHPRFQEMTEDHVKRAAKVLQHPGTIQVWSCVVEVDGEDREFPVKQLYMTAANRVASESPLITPADFIPHFAQARLKKLGFEVRYAGARSGTKVTHLRKTGAKSGPGSDAPKRTGKIPAPERIVKYLRDRSGTAFCDDCIARAVKINRHMAQQTTHPLGLTADFRRRHGTCSDCGRRQRLVTVAA